jgi:serpin B
MQTIAEGNNAFACDLIAQLRSEPGNLFFSPFSIHTALAMTADGARGETLDEMVKVLHLPKEAKARLAAGDVARYYALGGEGYELAVANNLWGQKGFPWKADFLERQRTAYGAELTSVDFKDAANREAARRTISASIEKTTRDKIKDLLKSEDLSSSTIMVLTNAIYFRANWEFPFDAKLTKEASFTLIDGSKKNVPMMNRKGRFLYGEGENFQAVGLTYSPGESDESIPATLLLILPRKHDGLADLEKELSSNTLKVWLKKMESRSGELSMPKFRCDSRFELGKNLKVGHRGLVWVNFSR